MRVNGGAKDNWGLEKVRLNGGQQLQESPCRFGFLSVDFTSDID